MTGKLSKNFHGVGIGPLSKILAVKVCPGDEKKKKSMRIVHILHCLHTYAFVALQTGQLFFSETKLLCMEIQ